MTAASPEPTSATPINSASMGRCMFIWRMLAALLSGLLCSSAFPPLEWDLLVWLALIPMLLIPQPRAWGERLLIGYFWGYVHCASSLLWLNEVGFGAGWLLALYCALFPMLWYALFSAAVWQLRQELSPEFPGAGFLYIRSLPRSIALCLFAAVLWVALEWLRSWLFTGFPWNQLGISQFTRTGIIQTAAWTGVYGISFLIVLGNAVLCAEFCRVLRRIFGGFGSNFPWHYLLLSVFLLPVFWLGSRPRILPPPETPTLLVSAIQGNLPQCRFWSEQEYQQALTTYISLSKQDLQQEPAPDLLVWPECAVPAPLEYPDYNLALRRLQAEIQTPLLLGATNHRADPNHPGEALLFNSAFLLDRDMRILGYYDKCHRVPFGEYVPGGKYLPWLVDLIGMGRDLTPGTDFNLIPLPKGGQAGVNICFEDVFPEISRAFTLAGANILMTITNDSWYNQSSGSRQHLSHVVFRAVECRRPILRSGNNSDTCLITPNGEILGILRDDRGSPFVAGAIRFEVPVYQQWGMTFYTRYGNVFAHLCVILTIVALFAMFLAWFSRKKRLLQIITSTTAGSQRNPDARSDHN